MVSYTLVIADYGNMLEGIKETEIIIKTLYDVMI